VNIQASHTLMPGVKTFPALCTADLGASKAPSFSASEKVQSLSSMGWGWGAEGLCALPCEHSSCGNV